MNSDVSFFSKRNPFVVPMWWMNYLSRCSTDQSHSCSVSNKRIIRAKENTQILTYFIIWPNFSFFYGENLFCSPNK